MPQNKPPLLKTKDLSPIEKYEEEFKAFNGITIQIHTSLIRYRHISDQSVQEQNKFIALLERAKITRDFDSVNKFLMTRENYRTYKPQIDFLKESALTLFKTIDKMDPKRAATRNKELNDLVKEAEKNCLVSEIDPSHPPDAKLRKYAEETLPGLQKWLQRNQVNNPRNPSSSRSARSASLTTRFFAAPSICPSSEQETKVPDTTSKNNRVPMKIHRPRSRSL